MTTATSTEEGLRAWAHGLYPVEAAVELLIRTGLARRLGAAVQASDDNSMWWIDWPKAMDEAGVLSGGERRIVALACSLGSSEVLVNLSDAVSGLDVEHVRLVLAALDHAAGARERKTPYIVVDQDGVPSRNPDAGQAVAPFVPWPGE